MQNNTYNTIPFVKIVLVYIIGILLGIYLPSFPLTAFFVLSFCVLLIGSVFKFFSKSVSKVFILKSVLVTSSFICILGLGYFMSVLHKQHKHNTHFGKYITKAKTSYYEIEIIDAPIEKQKSYKVLTKVLKIKQQETFLNTRGKLLLYFEKNDRVASLKPKDKLFIQSKLNATESPKNPNEFNYKTYLAFQNINYQSYAKNEQWHIHKHSENLWSNFIFKIKTRLQHIINTYLFDTDEQAVASALLLGNRSYLTDDILKAFSSSGATHILAVSGLHVGLFYGIISWILGFIKRFKKLKLLHPILCILSIWFYVALTGGSPSVVRAATMFSFIAIGLAMRRYINIYNIIAFSALLITLFNPYIITEVGFQLSYLAVIGIIYLQPKIYNLLYIENYLGDKIWAITAVSIAAQIATVPLILLYFHQFPNLFMLSNLVVIPAASIILYGGILLFAFSWNETILTLLGKLLSYIIKILNFCLAWIEQMPFALSDKIYISHFQALLLYLATISFVFSLTQKNKKLLYSFLIISGILSLSFSLKQNQLKTTSQLIVYHIPNYTAIDILDHQKSYSLLDSALRQNDDLMTFRIKHNWWQKRIKEQYLDFSKLHSHKTNSINLLYFKNKKIALIDNDYKYSSLTLNVDFAILSNSPKLNFKNFSQKIKANTYIFDTSNKKYKEKYWKQDCEDLNLNCYFVSDTTAFIQNL